MICQGTPSNWKDVARVVSAPVVDRSLPAVERDVYLVAVDGTNGRRTDESWILAINGLQLHSHFEFVASRR